MKNSFINTYLMNPKSPNNLLMESKALIEESAAKYIKNEKKQKQFFDWLLKFKRMFNNQWDGIHGICSEDWGDISECHNDKFIIWLNFKAIIIQRELNLNLMYLYQLYMESEDFIREMNIGFSFEVSPKPCIFLHLDDQGNRKVLKELIGK